MEKITAIQVLDVPVHPYSMDAAVQYLDDKIQEQKHSFVVTANAEIIMMCQDDAEYKNIRYRLGRQTVRICCAGESCRV